MEPTALIYDIQGYSVHDGPGIRTTVFLKGCPLRCPWCHSPESQSFREEICHKKTNCRTVESCGACLRACQQDAIDTRNAGGDQNAPSMPWIDRARCRECGACVQACAPKALYWCGKRYSVSEAMRVVLRDRAFFDASGGGVTLSGGEALSQPEFTRAFLRACKEQGLSTALDTTGFASEQALLDALPYSDLVLYDLKHMDSEKHERVIGVPNERILSNARLAATSGARLQIRVPVIPGFNDDDDNMEATSDFCASLGGAVTCVQLLPYHSLGVAKHERLQHDAPPFTTDVPSDELMSRVSSIFTRRNLSVIIH